MTVSERNAPTVEEAEAAVRQLESITFTAEDFEGVSAAEIAQDFNTASAALVKMCRQRNEAATVLVKAFEKLKSTQDELNRARRADIPLNLGLFLLGAAWATLICLQVM